MGVLGELSGQLFHRPGYLGESGNASGALLAGEFDYLYSDESEGLLDLLQSEIVAKIALSEGDKGRKIIRKKTESHQDLLEAIEVRQSLADERPLCVYHILQSQQIQVMDEMEAVRGGFKDTLEVCRRFRFKIERSFSLYW